MTGHPLTEVELLPCPFCGSTEIEVMEFEHVPQLRSWETHCLSCSVSNSERTEAEAIAAWNTRSSLQPSTEAVKLADELDAMSGGRSSMVERGIWLGNNMTFLRAALRQPPLLPSGESNGLSVGGGG